MDSTQISRFLDSGYLRLIIALAILLFTLAGIFAADRSLWADESMYLANMHLSWIEYFQPLPFYDQASPPFVSMLFTWILDITGNNIKILRIVILFLFILAVMYAWYETRKSFNAKLAAFWLLALLANAFVLRYATEVKHYGIEGVTALIAIGIYLRTFRQEGKEEVKSIYVLLAVCVLSSLFSYSILLVAVTLLVERVLRRNKSNRMHWIAALVIFAGLWGMLYIALLKKLVFFQVENYPDVYQLYMLRDGIFSKIFWMHSFDIIISIFNPLLLYVSIFLMAVYFAIKDYHEFNENDFAPLKLTAILLLLILFLSGVGLYPLVSERQFFYTLPFVALVTGWVIHKVNSCKNVVNFVAIVIVAFMIVLEAKNTVAAQRGVFDHQRTLALYSYLEKNQNKNILLWIGFRPTFDIYHAMAPLTGRTVLGRTPADSVVRPSIEDTLANFARVFESKGGYAAISHLREHDRYDLYTDWLISQVPGNETTILAMAHYNSSREKHLQESLKKRQCTSEQVFQDRGVKALRLQCP